MEENDPTLRGKIVNIQAGSTYEDTTYDQYVSVCLAEGQKIDLFDTGMLVPPELLNREVGLHILDFIAQVERTPSVAHEILVENLASRQVHFFGHVASVKKWRVFTSGSERRLTGEFVLDVGVGTIRVDTVVEQGVRLSGLENLPLSAGEFVHVWGGRLDLVGISELPVT